MTFAVNGLIEASDYNNLAGTNPTNVANTMNRVWGVGFGDTGYGQTGIGNVVEGNTITAAQWATLINSVNNARKHQSGSSYTNLTAPTAGDSVNFINTLQSRITDAYTNRLVPPLSSIPGGYLPGGYVVLATSTKSFSIVAAPGATVNGGVNFTIEFLNINAARYFFNAGGLIEMDYTSATNNNGTTRSTSLTTLMGNWGFRWIWANGSYKNGTGGNVSIYSTYGYYGIAQNTPANMDLIYSSGYYSSDFLSCGINATGGSGANGGNGYILYPSLSLTSSGVGATQPSDACNVTVTVNVRVTAANPIYISNSWGAVSLT